MRTLFQKIIEFTEKLLLNPDFHSLRHTFGTFLALSGTKPQIAQRLMRHSDPRLTQNLYTHLTVADTASERRFPDLYKADSMVSGVV